MQKPFICLNGEFIKGDKPVIDINNRAFAFGDAFFDTFHACHTEIQFFDHHYDRILKSLKLLHMALPRHFSEDLLREKTKRLLNANKIFKRARVRLTIYRKPGGRFIPETNDTEYILQAEALPGGQFELNSKGLILGLYPEHHKPVHPLSSMKTTNALLYIMAGIYKKEHQLDDCILLNEKGEICESISSNIFLVKNNKLFTPPLSSGSVEGTMRKTIIEAARELKLETHDDKVLKPGDLPLAEEVFLSNSIAGIRWAVAYRDTRYFNKTAGKLLRQVNFMAGL